MDRSLDFKLISLTIAFALFFTSAGYGAHLRVPIMERGVERAREVASKSKIPSSVEELFENAEELFNNGKTIEALRKYKEIMEKFGDVRGVMRRVREKIKKPLEFELRNFLSLEYAPQKEDVRLLRGATIAQFRKLIDLFLKEDELRQDRWNRNDFRSDYAPGLRGRIEFILRRDKVNNEIFGINNETKELLEESIRKEIRLLLMHELGEQFSVEVQKVSRKDRFYTTLEDIYKDVCDWLDIFEEEKIISKENLNKIRKYVKEAFEELLGAYIGRYDYPYIGHLKVLHLLQKKWFGFILDDEFLKVVSTRIKTNQGKYKRLRDLSKKKEERNTWQGAVERLGHIKRALGLRNNANRNRKSNPANLRTIGDIKTSI